MLSFDRYNESHIEPQGAGDARPTAQQIIDDENLQGALTDKVVLITGCSSGLGLETARVLLTTGATVFMTSRNVKKGEGVRETLLREVPSKDPKCLQLLEMDNSSLDSVRKAAEEFKSKSDRLNVLINNAGLAMPPKSTTKDGFETQFGVNHLAHFLLFQLLQPVLLNSSSVSFQSRVINVSSLVHRLSTVNVDDYNFEKSEYSPFQSYGSSKTANIWMANEIERRYAKQGIHALSLHPGGILTGLMDGHDPQVRAQMEMLGEDPDIKRTVKSIEQGAATTVLAAVGKAFEGVGGMYLEDCRVSSPVADNPGLAEAGFAPWAYDEEGEKKLWKDSERFVGVAE